MSAGTDEGFGMGEGSNVFTEDVPMKKMSDQ